MLLRFFVVSYARISVRRVGLHVGFDLRQRLYDQLQHQGSKFFGTYTIGDMMTRAVADIGLIQRLIAMGTILLVVLAFASVVGFGFMLALSPKLTLFVLPPLPFVFLYAWRVSKEMGVASRDVQDRLSDLSTHVQENLSGIRTIQAMVQEENEIARFGKTNQAYADAFYVQGESQFADDVVDAEPRGDLLRRDPRLRRHDGDERRADTRHVHGFFMYVNMVGAVPDGRLRRKLFQRAAVASDRCSRSTTSP